MKPNKEMKHKTTTAKKNVSERRNSVGRTISRVPNRERVVFSIPLQHEHYVSVRHCTAEAAVRLTVTVLLKTPHPSANCVSDEA